MELKFSLVNGHPETPENLQVNGTHWTSFLSYLNVGIPTTPIAVSNARSTSTSFRDMGFFFQSCARARGCCSRYSSLSVKYRSACSQVSLWMKLFVSSSKNNSKNTKGSFPIMFGIIPGISENGTGLFSGQCVCITWSVNASREGWGCWEGAGVLGGRR